MADMSHFHQCDDCKALFENEAKLQWHRDEVQCDDE